MQNQPDLLSEIIANCRKGVASDHGLTLSSVVLIRTRTIPKTTSGKIARSWCRRAYLDGSLNILSKWEAEKIELETRETECAEIDYGNENEKGEIELYTKNITTDIISNTKNKISKTSPSSPSFSSNDPNGKYSVIRTEPGIEEIDVRKEEIEKYSIEDKKSKESVTEIRKKTIPEIIKLLEKTLIQIASQSPAPISGGINQLASLASLGLDSFTLVQFKGVLEKR